MKILVYYDKKSNTIVDFFPSNLSEEKKNEIRQAWNQEIPRKILVLLSQQDDITAPLIKQQIRHSMSTLHENISRLETDGLISTKMIYEGNKQKIISTNVLCISKNTPINEKTRRFFNQSLWVDTEKSNKIIDFLNAHPQQYFSSEDISVKTGIPVDEVTTLLGNWDSQVTRAFSDFLKQTPFEKKVLYRARQ